MDIHATEDDGNGWQGKVYITKCMTNKKAYIKPIDMQFPSG